MVTRAPLDIIAENLSDDERASYGRLAKDAARIMAALAAEGFKIVRISESQEEGASNG